MNLTYVVDVNRSGLPLRFATEELADLYVAHHPGSGRIDISQVDPELVAADRAHYEELEREHQYPEGEIDATEVLADDLVGAAGDDAGPDDPGATADLNAGRAMIRRLAKVGVTP
jgi:hypothetical protein